jgi:hypothetical protein
MEVEFHDEAMVLIVGAYTGQVDELLDAKSLQETGGPISVPKRPGPADRKAFCGVGVSNGGGAWPAPRQASDFAAGPLRNTGANTGELEDFMIQLRQPQ